MKMFNSEVNSHAAYEPGRSSPGECDLVVIRNIDANTEAGIIFLDLERLGYRVHSIRNAMNNNTRRAAPIFFVELKKSPQNANILGVKRIANQNVVVEKYFSNPELVRCTVCQGLDHQADECNSFPICAWCGGPHMTRTCTVGRDFPPTCCRCGGRHPSNYKGCHIYRQRMLEARLKNGSENLGPGSVEDPRRLALVEESMLVQSPGAASGVSSGDSRGGTDPDFEYTLLSTMMYTQEMVYWENARNTLKLKMEHYLSMHPQYRDKILRK